MEGYRRFGRRGTAAPASYDFARLTARAAAAATGAETKTDDARGDASEHDHEERGKGLLEFRRHLNRLRFAAIGKQKSHAS